mmetsp:Transcript_22032/g.59426  ORF Transcript_22032/g.59426 Transcript_22032/m.59426 type:complete len:206 (+) Transcript_22032:82-699(+)
MLYIAPAIAALGLFNAKAPTTKSSTKMAATEFAYGLPGVTSFPGEFDPLGLSKDASEEQVKVWREAELTHGRVGMLAAAGFLVQESFHPLFDGSVTGPAIEHIPQIPEFFWFALTLAIGASEAYRVQVGWEDPKTSVDKYGTLKADYTPGDLGFDPLGLKPEDPEEFAAMQLKELNNGRLAMIAAAGFLAQESIDHKPILEHLGF